MLEKKESQRKTQTEMMSGCARHPLELVHFLDIDTNKITFQKPKSNKYNGSQIGMLYNGRTMFVKYEGVTPFGLKENFDKDGNYQGTSMQINCEGEYLRKSRELDQFFINAFYENKWGLAKNIPKTIIEGYDEHGQDGLWKRICKDPYGVNKDTKEREYLDYPSKMEFTLFYKNDRLETTIFDWAGKKLPNDSEISPRSRVKFVAALFSLTRGTFGLTLKPKLMQIMFKPEENHFDTCLLGSDDEPLYEKPISLNPDLGYDESGDEDADHESLV